MLFLPAAAGFAVLFALNFVLIASALVMLSAGFLCFPVGVLYCFGAISVVSDLAPPALAAAGAFLITFGICLCFGIYRFAPFSASLVSRYIFAIRGEKWRRVYFPKEKRGSLRIMLILSAAFLVFAAGTQLIVSSLGFEGTVIRKSICFENTKYLRISTSGLDFQLKFYEGDEILIEYVNDSDIIVQQADGNYLKLVQDDSFTLSLFAADQFDYHMTVWLPENDYREFYLSSGTGAITLDDTQSRFTEIHTRSGLVTINGASRELSVTSYDGDINCEYIAFVTRGTFTSESGNVSVSMPDYSGVALDFETETGWIDSEITDFDGKLYASIETEREAPLTANLYVTTKSGGFSLNFK